VKPSLTEILWRELKKHHKEYCKKLCIDPDEYWGKYQIHIIKESQGENVRDGK